MDSYNVIEERQCDDRWYLPRIDIEPDPRSRFFDPYCLDEGPLPPDDPAAHQYMHRVSTWIPGYKNWHCFDQAFTVENPRWYDEFPMERVNNVFRDYEVADADDTTGEISLVSYTETEGEGAVQPPPLDAPVGAQPGDAGTGELNIDPLNIDPLNIDPLNIDPLDLDADDYVPEYCVGDPSVDAVIPPGANVDVRPKVDGLTLEQAIGLSQIHSREYQTQIENVFLEALDLTLERFQFDVRYLPLPGIGLNHAIDGNGQNSRLNMDISGGISQTLPTGGQWAVEFLNNTLWLFSGDDETSTTSLLSYSLVQPLMRGAGRAVVLASLTQQERNLLYAVRELARFRQLFFTDVVADYLSLLETRQGIINLANNIIQTETQLERTRALEAFVSRDISEPLIKLPEGLEFPPELAPKIRYNENANLLTVSRTITPDEFDQLRRLSDDPEYQRAVNAIFDRLNTVTSTLTIVQLETELAGRRNELLSAEAAYQTALDAYKFQLGLPPDVVLTLDESFLEPFTLIDAQLFELETDVEEFVTVWGVLDDDDPPLNGLRSATAQLGTLIERVEDRGIELVLAEKQELEASLDRIMANKDPEDKERLAADLERDERILASTLQNFAEIERGWNELQERVANDNVTLEQRQAARFVIGELRGDLLQVTQNLQVILVSIRVEMIELNPFDIDLEAATEYALENRLDLMNARAAVMDARRAIEVAKNQLEAVLDVVVEGDIGTEPGTNPFDFRATRSTFRTGVQFTTPLDQIAQRNAYRASLINYQRARRAYMAAEDSVKIQVRRDWRQLKVLKKNFEIQRLAIRSSARQLDQTIARALDPSQAGNLDDQGLNLLQALNSVLNAQNRFIGIWVNYEQNRLNFYQDIGMMEIDSQGVWEDAYYQNWLRTGTPDVTATSPPSTPQGARRVASTHLQGRQSPHTRRHE